MQPFGSASECIPWLVVLIIECLAIVILNIITIVVFVKKKRQLQRRRTYLIIHLAIVDLLVGAVSGPLQIKYRMALYCPPWKFRRDTIWSNPLYFAFLHSFSFASLTNLIAISLERLHATFCPFRHRFVRKWVHRAIITVIWLKSKNRIYNLWYNHSFYMDGSVLPGNKTLTSTLVVSIRPPHP